MHVKVGKQFLQNLAEGMGVQSVTSVRDNVAEGGFIVLHAFDVVDGFEVVGP